MPVYSKFNTTCKGCRGRIKIGDPVHPPTWVCNSCALGAPTLPPPPRPPLTPTSEQERALDIFAEGGDMAIQAGAGTGKTSTLELLAREAQARRLKGRYVAFNKAIVEDSRARMPTNVKSSTAHALGYAAVGYRFKRRLEESGRMLSKDIAKLLRIAPVRLNGDIVSAEFLASQVIEAVRLFCQSADPEPTLRHFAYVEGIDQPNSSGQRTYHNNNLLRDHLLPYVKKAWEDAQSPHGVLPYDHAYYLKTAQLEGVKLKADFVLFDECQDASPVLLDMVQQQDCQLVYVGDPNQCQPTGTMVTVCDGRQPTRGRPQRYQQIPIEEITPGQRVLSYNVPQSHLRRTGSIVTKVASRPYSDDVVKVEVGNSSSTYTLEHKCIVRFGAAFADKWVVYLMRQGTKFRVGVAKGIQGGRLGFAMRAAAEGADGVWLLDICASKDEALLAELLTSWQYGIPTVRFRQNATSGITQDTLDTFWSTMGDLQSNARNLLTDRGLLLESPIKVDAYLVRQRATVIAAANLLDGMEMLRADDAKCSGGKQVAKRHWIPISVAREHYNGVVWSLEVAGDETYVADGIITHNCIYEWTGAVNAFGKLGDDVTLTTLSQSFRFGDVIAEVANDILAELDGFKLQGNPSRQSEISTLTTPHAILARTNGMAVSCMLDEVSNNRKAHLVGGGADVVSFVKAARELKAGKKVTHRDLACFKSWNDVQEYVANDSQGKDLKTLVNLVDRHGAGAILSLLMNQPTESAADVVVSTAHKAKGREWDAVKLTSDFDLGSEEGGSPSPSELRLLYVAVTRARLKLDPFAVDHFREYDEEAA